MCETSNERGLLEVEDLNAVQAGLIWLIRSCNAGLIARKLDDSLYNSGDVPHLRCIYNHVQFSISS